MRQKCTLCGLTRDATEVVDVLLFELVDGYLPRDATGFPHLACDTCFDEILVVEEYNYKIVEWDLA